MQISDEIIKVLEYLCDKIGITIDWTSANVLPYLQQLCEKFIKWEIATSLVWMAIGIIFIIIGCILIKSAKSQYKKYEEADNVSDAETHVVLCIISTIVAAILILIAVLVIPSQIFDVVECCTFPEKTIYDYIQSNISTHQ